MICGDDISRIPETTKPEFACNKDEEVEEATEEVVEEATEEVVDEPSTEDIGKATNLRRSLLRYIVIYTMTGQPAHTHMQLITIMQYIILSLDYSYREKKLHLTLGLPCPVLNNWFQLDHS